MSALKYYDTTTGTWKYLAQGVKGDKGDAGTNGTNGTDGTNGTNGQGYTQKGSYTTGVNYAPYDVVYYQGSTYVCILAVTNVSPPSATYWQKFALGFTGQGVYSSSTTYYAGDVVSYNNSSYYCLGDGTVGRTPTNTTYWGVLASGGTGVPAGGNAEDILVKTSNTVDYQVAWQSPAITTRAKFEAFLANAKNPTTAIPATNTSLVTSTSNTAISGATVYPYDSGKFTFRGLNPTTYTNGTGTTYYQNNATLTSVGDLIFNPFWVEFDYYGQNFDIRYNTRLALYAQIWVWVDGVPTTALAVRPNQPVNQDSFYQVVLPSVKQRRIRVMLAYADFGGIGLSSVTETIFPTNQQLLKVAFLDASWLAGSNGGTLTSSLNVANHLAVQYGEMLNVDYYNLSVAGTGYVKGTNVDPILGYVTASGANGENWCAPNRLTPITTIAPDLVVIQGTVNDDPYTGAGYQLGAHATYVYDYIKTNLPNTKIIVFTRGSNTETSSQARANVAAVSTAANAHSSVIGVVDIYTEGWVTGTNTDSDTTGTPGNGQIYIHGADLHPNYLGNQYYASRMFDRTFNIIKTYARKVN